MIYGIPMSNPALEEAVNGFAQRHSNPWELAQITIIVNSARTAQNLRAHCLAKLKIAPAIFTLEQYLEHTRIWARPDPPPSEMSQILAISALLSQVDPEKLPINRAHIFDLAFHMAELLNACLERGKTPEDLLALPEGEYAEHWQLNRLLFEILLDYWQNSAQQSTITQSFGAVQNLRQYWQSQPPQNPIYIFASTGSRPLMREFMDTALSTQNAALIFPAYDFDPPENMSEDHPQFGYQNLLQWLAEKGHEPQVERWAGADLPLGQFIQKAMAPPPYTEIWYRALDELKAALQSSTQEVTWLEADHSQDEANALTALIYDAIQNGERVAMVSNDRALVRKMIPALETLAIPYDDSAGRPLALAPAGIFATSLLEAMEKRDAVSNVAFLAHPFTKRAADRAAHMQSLRFYESEILRGAMNPEAWPNAPKGQNTAPHLEWIEHWRQILTQDLPPTQSLQGWLFWHLETMRQASGIKNDWAELGSHEMDDLVLFTQMEALAKENLPTTSLSLFEYRRLWEAWLSRAPALRSQQKNNAPLQILGKYELRAEAADCIIMAALNEGQWPDATIPDMWLNRDMRRQLELETPERFIGLSAHDFISGFGAPRIVFSRAQKSGDAPNVQSRFLTRIEVLLSGAHPQYFQKAKARGAHWIKLGQEFDRPQNWLPFEPRPAIHLAPQNRPAHYSATGLERLLHNPYRAYAERVLGLRELAPLGGDVSAAAMGIVIHRAFELQSKAAGTPPQPLDQTDFHESLQHAMDEENLAAWDRFQIQSVFENLQTTYLFEENARRQNATEIQTENNIQARFEHQNLQINLQARFDRLDLAQAGEWSLYDYKSGANAYSAASINPLKALQIPLMALVVDEAFKGTPAEIGVIRYRGKIPGSFAPLKGFNIEDFRESFEQFLLNYFAPDFHFVAATGLESYDAAYEHLARFGEWIASDEPQIIEVAP